MTTLLTVAEAAVRLGYTPRAVQLLCKAGRLPAQKIGRDWLIDPRAVDAFTRRRVGRPRKAQSQ